MYVCMCVCMYVSNWMLMWWSPMWWWNPAGKFQEISQNFLKMQSLTYFFFAWTFFLDTWTTCFEVRYPLVRVTSAKIPHLVDYVIPKDERNFGDSCSGNGNYIIIVAFVFPTITHNPIPVSIGMMLHAMCMPLAHHKKRNFWDGNQATWKLIDWDWKILFLADRYWTKGVQACELQEVFVINR